MTTLTDLAPSARQAAGTRHSGATPDRQQRRSLMLFLLGGALAGAGAGAAFKGSVSTVIAIAPPTRRGETLAGLFLAAYFGIAVPVLGLGLATQFVSAQIAVLGFAAVLVAVAVMASSRLAASTAHYRRSHRSSPPSAPPWAPSADPGQATQTKAARC